MKRGKLQRLEQPANIWHQPQVDFLGVQLWLAPLWLHFSALRVQNFCLSLFFFFVFVHPKYIK